MLDEYSTVLRMRGYSICVPLPQAYILHKLLIHEQRSEAKQEKDLGAVRDLLAAMQGFPAELAAVQKLFDELPKKTQVKIRKTCENNAIYW